MKQNIKRRYTNVDEICAVHCHGQKANVPIRASHRIATVVVGGGSSLSVGASYTVVNSVAIVYIFECVFVVSDVQKAWPMCAAD